MKKEPEATPDLDTLLGELRVLVQRQTELLEGMLADPAATPDDTRPTPTTRGTP